MIFLDDPIVMTGMGVVSPLGNRLLSFRDRLEKGQSGLTYLEDLDLHQLPVKKAFLVKEKVDFDQGEPFLDFALHATKDALEDAGLLESEKRALEGGVVFSSSKGGLETTYQLKQKQKELNEVHYFNCFTNRAADAISKTFSLGKLSQNPVAACATGVHAISLAAMSVYHGEADFIVAGASDASISPFILSAYDRMKAYSHDDMRPFDRRRSGFIIGEGAGALILEKESTARKRGARIYARLKGFLLRQDLGSVTYHDPEQDTLSLTVRHLLKDASISPQEIDYVNLHGTSTKLGDEYEAQQMNRIFDGSFSHVTCNALKSMFGHMLGASGAVETIATALSIYDKKIYPTINCRELEPFVKFDLNRNRLRKKNIDHALKLSMGFGGHVSVLLLSK